MSDSPPIGPLRYLIGADSVPVTPGEIIEAPFQTAGTTCYGNLRREQQDGLCKPYLPADDITKEYGEYCPDPRYPGFLENVDQQIDWVKRHGGIRMELDNPDSEGLDLQYVLIAHDHAWKAGLHTIAKNPLLLDDPGRYCSHPSIDLAIVEHGAGGSDAMQTLRAKIKAPLLAIRFVAFIEGDEDGSIWARNVANNIRRMRYRNMGVTISRDGEYTSSHDVLVPDQF
jgi:hypothetical protein